MNTSSGKIAVGIETNELLVHVSLEGDLSQWSQHDSAIETVGQIFERLRKTEGNNLIIDFTHAVGQVSYLSRYQFLRRVIKLYFAHRNHGGLHINIALVVNAEHSRQSSLATGILANRGMQVQVFSSREAATAWISEVSAGANSASDSSEIDAKASSVDLGLFRR